MWIELNNLQKERKKLKINKALVSFVDSSRTEFLFDINLQFAAALVSSNCFNFFTTRLKCHFDPNDFLPDDGLRCSRKRMACCVVSFYSWNLQFRGNISININNIIFWISNYTYIIMFYINRFCSLWVRVSNYNPYI